MVFTQSRGAWLGLMFAFAVFALLHDRKLVVLGIIAVLVMPLVLPDAVIGRFLSIGNLADSSTSYRVHIWNASRLIIRDYWVSGIGLGEGSFSRIYQMYAFNAVISPHSHNLYLQIIIDMGIAGLTVFAAVVIYFYKNALLSVKTMAAACPSFGALPSALAAAMTGYLIQGMTDNVFYNYRIVAFFWFCTALASAMYSMGQGLRSDVS
jgi:O-antigen ligase